MVKIWKDNMMEILRSSSDFWVCTAIEIYDYWKIPSVLISFLSLNGVCIVKEPTSDGVEIKISGLRGLPDWEFLARSHVITIPYESLTGKSKDRSIHADSNLQLSS